MEMMKETEAELQIHTSLVPETPIKPILPGTEPIFEGMQDRQQGPDESSGSEKLPPGFDPTDQVQSHVPTREAMIDTGLDDIEDLLEGVDSTSWPGAAAKVPFMELLALAEDRAGATGGSFSCFSNPLLGGKSLASDPPNRGGSGSGHPQFSWNIANRSTQNSHGVPNLPANTYNVNLPPRPHAEGPNGAIPHFAPITPDKVLSAKGKVALETRDFGDKDQTDQQWFGDSDAARRLILEGKQYVDELLKANAEDPSALVPSPLKEDNKIDKVDDQGLGMSRTPQQKPRRKKHRPKVISEKKPRTPKPRTPKNGGTDGETRVKRKYVRRKGIEKPKSPTLTTEATVDSGAQNGNETLKKSCRRALNFEGEQQTDENIAGQSACVVESMAHDIQTQTERANADEQLIEVKVGDAPEELLHRLKETRNQMLREDVPFQESEGAEKPPAAQASLQQEKLDAHCSGTSLQGTTDSAPDIVNVQILTSENTTSFFKGEQLTDSKRKCYDPCEQAQSRCTNTVGLQFNSLQAHDSITWLHFPTIHKKKRTEKGQVSPSDTSSSTNGQTTKRLWIGSSVDAERTNLLSLKVDHGIATLHGRETVLQDKQQAVGCVPPFCQTERLTKKRSRGLTRVRDSASLSKLAEYCTMPNYPSQQSAQDEDSQNTRESMLALMMKMESNLSKNKRSKRLPLVNPAYQMDGSVPVHYHTALTHVPGHQPASLIDAIVDNLENLDINRESNGNVHQEQTAIIPYGVGNQEHQNMLVLYRREGTIVPFDGPFDPIKKRRPRPKVDLDEETTRVWRLLLEDINSEGIDGTDEEKERWWKEERRVFKGRTDSFIARMHLVQGDRRFSPWKGSVVDSVVGVFLTQNVSDHLSSSAFMSLAARFPKNPRQDQCFEEGIGSVNNEPEPCTLDLEYTSKWSDKMSSPTVCDRASMTVNETENNDEIEGVNSEESFISTAEGMRSLDELLCNYSNSNPSSSTKIQSHSGLDKSARDFADPIFSDANPRSDIDIISSQESAASSQNSIGIQEAGIDERKLPSLYNSEIDDPTNMSKLPKLSSEYGPTSFTELLHASDSYVQHEVYTHETRDMPSKTRNAFLEPTKTDHGVEREDIDASNAMNSTLLEDECSQESRGEGKSSDNYKAGSGSSMGNGVTATIQSLTDDKMMEAKDETPSRSIDSNQICSGSTISKSQVDEHSEHFSNVTYLRVDDRVEEHTCVPKLSCQNQQNRGSVDNLKSSNQESEERCLSELVYPRAPKSKELNISVPKAKKSAAGKDKKAEFDWDSLRKQAECSGSKKARCQNTMDSVDWEAVRCADVNEIAQTIKDRGMNNVLAERIQDFLNRIVREHGSIDLEWLRDVPPDKAKEYLLSFRGLGLKSVECVRLLTLHHLAFPVDTNVGRIAVRLGWVPLQPLPESLQLHLLELYPVLESIQKYLWPRLCKLDQRTLYELHYQMITFGKVFCTKSKPNCNACPMRGECRHFASAFASARLALPGPEQKSIVCSSETLMPTQNTSGSLQLPSPSAVDKSEEQQLAKHGARNCQPIIEEPASPEPDCTQIVEIDRDETDIEDVNGIPTIRLNIEEFTQNLQNYMQHNMELQEGDMSKALVALTPEAASIPAPKLKIVSRLRTEHLVYEIPDGHPLLHGLDQLEPDDPCKYLLAIWTPGETANSIEPPEQKCNSQEHGMLCNDNTCSSCHCARESNSQTVRGTILIPCRTAMRGSFPLNGTYFQVNEVFADHESSLQPIDVPRDWLWKLHRRTVYFGTSVPAIFKGLSTEGIQHCFWRGYVCVRGFDRQTRAPRPLMARLHFPASKLPKTRGKTDAAS